MSQDVLDRYAELKKTAQEASDKLTEAKTRLSAAQETEQSLMSKLQQDFGLSSVEDATKKLAEMEGELESVLNEMEQVLSLCYSGEA